MFLWSRKNFCRKISSLPIGANHHSWNFYNCTPIFRFNYFQLVPEDKLKSSSIQCLLIHFSNIEVRYHCFSSHLLVVDNIHQSWEFIGSWLIWDESCSDLHLVWLLFSTVTVWVISPNPGTPALTSRPIVIFSDWFMLYE